MGKNRRKQLKRTVGVMSKMKIHGEYQSDEIKRGRGKHYFYLKIKGEGEFQFYIEAAITIKGQDYWGNVGRYPTEPTTKKIKKTDDTIVLESSVLEHNKVRYRIIGDGELNIEHKLQDEPITEEAK